MHAIGRNIDQLATSLSLKNGAYTVHFSENVVFTEKHERNVDSKKTGVAIGRGG